MINTLRMNIHRAQFFLERRDAIKDPVAWREKHPLAPTSSKPMVTFVTPIFEKRRAPDWDSVVANLKTTVRAVRNQKNSSWRMIICSQDVPEGIEFDDQVIFLRYPVKHFGSSDKLPKLRHIARFVAKTFRDDGYVFFLDGDDIPHPNLVDFIVQDNNGHGYYLDQGYLGDLSVGKVYERVYCDGETKPFYWYCGSCNAVRFDARKDKSHVVHVGLRGDHMVAVKNLHERVGLSLAPVPFPAMIYSINHGTSDQDLLAEANGNDRRIPGLRCLDEREARGVLSSFDITDK